MDEVPLGAKSAIDKQPSDLIEKPTLLKWRNTNQKQEDSPQPTEIFQSKSDHDTRAKYLSKLMCRGVWLAPVQRPKTHQNIVILDYDDTLLPTTDLDPEDENDMENLARTHREKL
eukprot:CAMPEP_0170506822 /NCGR_PEP_ID=MMETSP0208-20121228/56401_1 /TAXON_ID=197538 /ORGANISM="Strombidium inclinatum, Strain S3" /LENGTH=114 /DNA_ID=CAMNT_0010788615 /DNA_START=196 /DNA_END=540 /DNA_ORIENTATION=+